MTLVTIIKTSHLLLSQLVNVDDLDHCDRVWIAMKFGPYSQFGFVTTPLSRGMRSGDRPQYGPKKRRA